ncbi:MAG: hypothetical protein HOP35_06240 [Nitrospira sp.]|nr:hypothetical protein [Nitrospira sp.]
MHMTRRSGQGPLVLAGLACLLVIIRLVAGYICATCPNTEFDAINARTFHLHSASDHDPCLHGKSVQPSPFTGWACVVTHDEGAFILPEIPRLPVVVSVFVPLVLLLVSYRTLPLIAAHGRGPPASHS